MIVVGFLHVGKISKVAQIMVASVKRVMPAAKIVQMTDYDTKPVTGVDEVIRKRYDGRFLMPYRMLHLQDFPESQAIFLDTDVVVHKDLAPVFDEEFDVGLTIRLEPIMGPNGADVTKAMPYNTGVMFSKQTGKPFWAEAHQYCLSLPKEAREWWGDQLSVKAVADTTSLKVKTFPCDLYNYTPESQNEDLSNKFVVHYKGERKQWMLASEGMAR